MMEPQLEHLHGHVVVWMAQVSAAKGALTQFESWLDVPECARGNAFRFEDDRTRFTLGRGLARRCLGHYLGRSPGSIAFVLTEQGRPVMLGANGLEFNITHAGDLVSVAVTTHARVGIDIERLDRKLQLNDLAERILSPEDFRKFQLLREDEKRGVFFRIWTRKEAYLKARGEGISAGLQQISVSFEADGITPLTDLRDESDALKWRMHSLGLPADYAGCVACDDAGKRIELLRVRFENGEAVV